GAITTLHRTNRDRPARRERRDLTADQIKVAHAIKILVSCHTGGAVAEAELGTEIDDYFAPAICRLALKCLASAPLIQWKRQSHFPPRRWIGRIMVLVRRGHAAKYRKAPCRGGEHHPGHYCNCQSTVHRES